jgi:hypothetical protein
VERALEEQTERGSNGDGEASVVPTYTWRELEDVASAGGAGDIVAGLLSDQDRAMWYGYGGVGKSLAAVELALSTQLGTPFLGKFQTQRRRVGIIDEESSRAQLGKRLALVRRGRAVENGAGDLPVFAIRENLRLDSARSLDQIANWTNSNEIGLLILDTLSRMHGGDENLARDMVRIDAALKELQRRHLETNGKSLAILFTHHAPKPREGGGNRAETMARGSTDLYNAVDSAVYLRRGREQGEVIFEHSKARWGRCLPPFLVQLVAGEGLRLDYVGTADEVEGKLDRALEILTTALGESPMFRQDLLDRAAAVSIPARTVERALGQLEAKRRVTKTRVGRTVRYELTPAGEL